MFKNRQDAGKKLAEKLLSYAHLPHHLVVGLARGGIVVAKEVSQILRLPLEILVPRKIGAPTNPELAIGAIAGDVIVLDPHLIDLVGAAKQEIQKIIDQEKEEMARREKLYRGNRGKTAFQNQTIILVDDGIATGLTLRASIQFLKKCQVKSIIVAAPAAHPDAVLQLEKEVDHVICVEISEDFWGISQFYEEFHPVNDEQVCKLLKSQ